ncbi:MAG: response regulator [Pseudomonadota bacterium]|nr:response regulator [Pseudomonadota bacterium]
MTEPTQLSILVAEDESLLRMMASDLFEGAGFKVIEAASGESALKQLGGGPIAALFTDVELGGNLDGFKLARMAHERNPDTAIFVVSGRRTPDPADLPPGAVFVSKPYDLDRVLESLQSMIDAANAH